MIKRASSVARSRSQADFTGQRVGRIASIDAGGVARVDFPGNPSRRPVVARSTLPVAAGTPALGSEVLLAFDDGDPSLPIVCGVVHTELQPKATLPSVKLDVGKSRDVQLDGRQLLLEAQQQILLRCGKSSLLLRRDGRVELRGAYVISRSSGPNKIKGASIDLN